MRGVGLVMILVAAACGGAERGGHGASNEVADSTPAAGREGATGAAAALAAVVAQSGALADSVEARLRPVHLLRPDEKAALRRYSNAENLASARLYGVRARDRSALDSLVAAGRLVRLEDGRYWVVRDLDASQPFVTPATKALLERIGAAFQGSLQQLELPPLRLEISSALRTAEDQASLRRTNVNAAAGMSAHEYGTTVDVAYSGYAAPQVLPVDVARTIAAALAEAKPALEEVARRTLERVAARKSRELEAILGGVLHEAQSRGEVLVTLEQLEPVYHITVRRGDVSGTGEAGR